MCVKCNQFKPPRAHHCSECGRCIIKMDHHCPYVMIRSFSFRWINNCVGVANTKFFILFLVYTFLYCSVSTVLSISFFIHRMLVESELGSRMVGNAIIVLFGGFFSIFTISMSCDTFSVVQSGTTCSVQLTIFILAIDVLKGISYNGTLKTGLIEVFGGKGRFSLNWLLPIKPKWEDPDEVLGYQNETTIIVNDWVNSTNS